MSRYAHLDGVVVVPARSAFILERALGLNEFRIAHRGQDAELDQVLSALHQAALAYPNKILRSDRGTHPGTGQEPASHSGVMTASDIARTLGITTRAVRRAATDGRLTGRYEGGQWRFTPEDAARWAATRKQH